KCLRSKHKLQTVGEAEGLAAPLIEMNGKQSSHRPNNQCNCRDCTEIREVTNCEHPHFCMVRSQELLDTLPPKWDPHVEQPEDYEGNFDNIPRLRGYRLTTTGGLSEFFQVFTDRNHTPSNDTYIRRIKMNNNINLSTVATDGSCINNGQDTASTGAGIYFAENDPRNRSLKLHRQ
ncbi:hypothetical protein K435DRAFT_669691, partial [Dendrothele bispora CBS 962.96]